MNMKVKPETIIRTIVLALALVNQILVATGRSPLPFENETVAELVSTIFTLVASTWAWWKNNSFTQAALHADEVMAELKSLPKE